MEAKENEPKYLDPRQTSYDQRDTERLLTRLRKVFKDGYRPARGPQTYSTVIDHYTEAFNVVNCLGHALNLTNEQLSDYHIIPYKMFGRFPEIAKDSNRVASGRLLDFIKAIGLKIEPCDPNKPINDFKSWKVALYFENNCWWHKDFHFLLEEAPYVWSSKIGFTSYMENLYTKQLPYFYENATRDGYIYDFYETYKITNPNADENNPYIHRYIRNFGKQNDLPVIADIIPVTDEKDEEKDKKNKRHCIICGSKEENYENTFETNPLFL